MLKKDTLTVYYVVGEKHYVLGSIGISTSTAIEREEFMSGVIEAKERIEPTPAKWHANNIFNEDGSLKMLQIRNYGGVKQWFFFSGDTVKIEKVKGHQRMAQEEYYYQRIALANDIPDDSISAMVVKHAIAALYRKVVLNLN